MALRFAHCSDIHLLNLEGVRPWQFLNKRITGAVNLALKRRRAHNDALFDRIVEHAHQLDVDRLVITGDLTNLALASEFAHVAEKLDQAGLPVTVIPGNHDAYTRGSARHGRFEQYLAKYMEGERPSGSLYPFVQRYPGVALIGISTAVPTLPLYATGKVGTDQLTRLDQILADLGRKDVSRVVLIHHPVVDGVSSARHDLLDISAFGEVIARRGAELILHGHEHRELVGLLPGPDTEVPVHGVSSATALSQKPGREGAFRIYDIEPGSIARETFCWQGEDFAKADFS